MNIRKWLMIMVIEVGWWVTDWEEARCMAMEYACSGISSTTTLCYLIPLTQGFMMFYAQYCKLVVCTLGIAT